MVMRLVNELTSPITLLEKVWTPVTIEAAISAPGRALDELRDDGKAGADVDVVGAGRYVGS